MSKSPWLLTPAAAESVGISAQQLHRLRRKGFFKLGTHFRIISPPDAIRPTYQWHSERCAKALEIPMEKRS